MSARLTTGVWCPTLTPVDDDLNPDVGMLASHCTWLLEQGCTGVVLFGTTGEANSFTAEERRRVLEGLLAAGVSTDTLIVGTGCCAAGDTIALTKHALANGCPRVLVLPPFYYKEVSEQGTIAAYARTIEGVGDDRLRFYFYRIPQMSGVDITASVIDAIVGRFGDQIAGMKDSSTDRASVEVLCRRYAGRMDVLVGSERFLASALAIGAAGCISATANVNAPLIRALFDDPSDERQNRATAARATYESAPMIPALKAATAARTGDARWRNVRPPLVAAPGG